MRIVIILGVILSDSIAGVQPVKSNLGLWLYVSLWVSDPCVPYRDINGATGSILYNTFNTSDAHGGRVHCQILRYRLLCVFEDLITQLWISYIRFLIDGPSCLGSQI